MDQTPTIRISHYSVRSELGTGRYGKLYFGRDQTLETEVIIKILPENFWRDPKEKQAFEALMKQLAILDHPAIVPIEDMGDSGGHPYLVMHFMPGGSLAEKLKHGRMNMAEAGKILWRLAAALDAAHAQGLIHGNIKPTNILFNAQGEACLSDFQIPGGRPAENLSAITEISTGAAYLSPEQASGEAADARSDIYSLGAVLYEMLSGCPVFQGETPLMVAAKQKELPIPDICRINPAIPLAVKRVLDQAMAKDPEQRYLTAESMAREFLEAAKEKPDRVKTVRAKPVKSTGSSLAWVWISGGAVILACLTVAVVGIAAGWMGPEQLPAGVAALFTTPTETPTITLTSTTVPTATRTETPRPPTLTRIPLKTRTATPQFSETPQATPTETPTITAMPTETQTATPAPVVIGGADKIAFINESDIWVANLDGSEMVRLTSEKAVRTDLRWRPDGEALIYLQNECYYMVTLASGTVEKLTCLNDFAISRDMKQMVIGEREIKPDFTEFWNNYLMPYDLTKIPGMSTVPKDQSAGGCPYVGGRMTQFNNAGTRLATVIKAPVGSRLVDFIKVFGIGQCGEYYGKLDLFPGDRFTMRGFSGDKDPAVILDYGWDGEELFALHGNVQNGFGDMVIYNMRTHKADVVNPIDGKCCYQDIQWSPDGQYILFAYQAINTRETKLYYIPYGTLNTGLTYEPVNIPYYFFAEAKARIEPALRPIQPSP
ncbi:MAG TPA: protein kinase [Anaerolineaceae bacterium]|nr:protein kinase [Anaerolineaceae bacterium]HPN53594.1 protein kinase [Anaerolineaceae bacterium]